MSNLTLDGLIINFIMQHKFGPLFAPLIRIEEESDQPYIMCVDIDGTTIRWNKKRTQGWPMHHLFTVIGHEMGHLIAHVGTPARILGQFFRPGQDPVWDVACEIFADCFAIHGLHLKPIPLMETKERREAIRRFKDHTTKEIYNELKRMSKDKFDELKSQYLGDGFDIIIIPGKEASQGDEGVDVPTLVSILKALKNMGYGKLPGELEHLLESLTQTKVDISRRLALWLKDAAAGSSFDYHRIDPRYYAMHRVLIPGLGGRKLRLLIGIDGSGSTSPYFAKFVGVIKHNLSVFPQLDVDVVCFDTEIYHTEHITRMNLSNLNKQPYRAGGTSFNDVLNYAHKKSFRNVLIITDADGELDQNLLRGLNVLWCVIGHVELYPQAEVIRIDLED